MRAAGAVPHEGVEVRVERLPAVTPDGRTYYPEGAPPDSGSPLRRQLCFGREFALSVGQISEPRSRLRLPRDFVRSALPRARVPLEERRVRLRIKCSNSAPKRPNKRCSSA